MWNDLGRSAGHWIDGADDNATEMGLEPLLSGNRSEDEGLFIRQHGYWAKPLIAALDEPDDGNGRITAQPANWLRVVA